MALEAAKFMPVTWMQRATALLLTAQGFGWGHCGAAVEVAAINNLLTRTGRPKPRTVMDVGANVGDWTAAAVQAWPGARIFAVEPSAACCADLRTRFQGDTRVTVVPVAVGAENSDAVLFADAPGSGHASLSAARYIPLGITPSFSEQVSLRTIESLAETVGVSCIDVLKLDIEGLEMYALQGLGAQLDCLTAVQFEWGEAARGTSVHFSDLWRFLSAAGFDIYRISPRGPILVSQYSGLDEMMSWTNYVALRC